MKKKDTTELLDTLKKAETPADLEEFLFANEKELLSLTFSEYLKRTLANRGLLQADVIKAAGINHSHGCHIFQGSKRPGRPKALALALALGLTADETKYLLYYARLPQLYVRDAYDSVIIHALNQHLSVVETNELLLKLHLSPLLE